MDELYPISVLLPLRLEWLPVYYSAERLERGQVVKLIFSKKEYFAVVWEKLSPSAVEASLSATRAQQGSGKEPKILSILDASTGIPAVSEQELQLWDFLAGYYLCTLGEVYKAARPKQSIDSAQAAASRLERLKARLAKTNLALEKRHRSDITERLLQEKRRVSDQISLLSRAGRQDGGEKSASKPKVLIGSDLKEAYLQEIRLALSKGGQVLLLCPEIAYCSRLEEALRTEFGELLQIVNSHRSAAQRQEAARLLRSGEGAVVLGTRSAIFLPFSNLSLVVIDNEHESSYKQSEPAPRYNARDAAIWLAAHCGARVILGSPSPSFETLFNVESGKYDAERIEIEELRNWSVVDIVSERRKNGMLGALSRKAADEIRQWKGPVSLIRGWEREDELRESCGRLFPQRELRLESLRSFKARNARREELVVLLQADAFLSKDDFRSDERAMQLIHSLSGLAQRLVVQTGSPASFDGSRGIETLMEERRRFGFPPYSRMINLHSRADGTLVAQHFLKRDAAFGARKAEIAAQLGKDCYADVDPI